MKEVREISDTEMQLSYLLEGMSDEGSSSRGNQRASWYAYRDAEKLADARLIPLITRSLENEPNIEERRHLYFILGHVGRNSGDASAQIPLNAALRKEKDRYILSVVLEALGRQARLVDAAAVREFVRDPRWLVRHTAIEALRADRTAESESLLLQFIQATENADDLSYAIGTLSRIGTKRCIPILAPFIHHHVDDVKCAAVASISKVGSNDEESQFLDALTDRSAAAKSYAVAALVHHGSERAIPAVVARLKALLRPGRIDRCIPSEIFTALSFLARFVTTSGAARNAVTAGRDRFRNNVIELESSRVQDLYQRLESEGLIARDGMARPKA